MSIGAPTTTQRATILASLLVDTPVADSGSSPDAADAGGGGLVGLVAARTPGFVAADLRLLCQEAVMLAVKGIDADGSDADPSSVQLASSHFDKALVRLPPWLATCPPRAVGRRPDPPGPAAVRFPPRLTDLVTIRLAVPG